MMKHPLLILCSCLAAHAGLADTLSTHRITTPQYEVHITDPGFRMEVSSAKGVALPADPEAGLYFSGHSYALGGGS